MSASNLKSLGSDFIEVTIRDMYYHKTYYGVAYANNQSSINTLLKDLAAKGFKFKATVDAGFDYEDFL